MKYPRPLPHILVIIAIFSSLLLTSGPVIGQSDLGVTGSVNPDTAKAGDSIHILVIVMNNGAVDMEDASVQIFIYKSTPEAPQKTQKLILPSGGQDSVDYYWPAKGSGEFTVLITVVDTNGVPLEEKTLATKITVKKVEKPAGNPLFQEIIPGIPLLYLLIIIIVIVVIVVAIVAKKKKKGTQVEITGEGVEVTGRVAWGKMPVDYYTERRDRLNKLRPVGLTRDGRTILGNSSVGDSGIVAVEAEEYDASGQSRVCPKCTNEMEADWKSCMRCDAGGSIRGVKDRLNELNKLGVSLDQVDLLIRRADASFQSENFTEVEMFARDALVQIKQAKADYEKEKKAKEEAETVVEEEKVKTPDNCKSCGMGLQQDWDKCPVCGMTVEDMLSGASEEPEPEPTPEVEEEPPEVVEKPNCVSCGNEIETEGGPCVHCNTSKAVSNAELRVKELRTSIQNVTLSKELQMEVNEAIDLFQDAKGAFFDKDYQTAVGLAGETIEIVEEIMPKITSESPPPTPTPTPTPAPTPTEGTKCPKCGMNVKPNWELCPACESPLQAPAPAPAPAANTCPNCGKTVKERWAMCPYCESPLK